ncbi:MAG: HAD family hydrolase [Desulfomonilaceae bacterium]
MANNLRFARDALYKCGGDHNDALGARLLDAYKEISPFPDAGPMLEALSKTGIAKVILTNGSKDMVNSAIRVARFTDKFNAVFSVDDVKIF